MTKRIATVVVLLAFVCTACGGSSQSGTAPTTVAPSTSATSTSPTSALPDVAAQLLTLADLPAGWSVDNSSSSGGSNLKGCDTKSLDLKSQEIARAEAAFKGGATLPSLDQTIGAFSTADRAASAYAKGTGALDACKNFTITESSHTYNGTAGQMSLGATYGDKSNAYQFVINVQGLNLGIDEVAVLKGSEVTSITYADLGTPDLATVNSLVSKATSKMP